jgi:hypothetical protein
LISADAFLIQYYVNLDSSDINNVSPFNVLVSAHIDLVSANVDIYE